MAYSRWSKDSIWYCFWSAVGPDNEFKLPTKKLKDGQVFEICDDPSMYITYGELKKDFKGRVKEIEKFYTNNYPKKPTFQQMGEMRKYLLEFIWDIDDHFKWNKFFLYEWYYPVRKKIIWKWRTLTKTKTKKK